MQDDATRGDLDARRGSLPRSGVPQNTLPVKPSPVIYDRLTVVEMISFASVDGVRAPPVESKYSRVLRHTDQPYQRSYKVTETPTPLDLGWAREWDGVGLLHISNDEGIRPQYIPTPQERVATAARVVELGEWLIRPGESQRGVPKDIKTLMVRCQSGEARITVTIYPA